MVDGRPVNQKNREGETDRKKNREREGKTSPAQVEGDREGKESSPTSPGEVERVAMEIREREGVLPGRRRLSGRDRLFRLDREESVERVESEKNRAGMIPTRF